MKLHRLSGKEYLQAAGVGFVTAIILSAIMVTGLKTGVSPMPAPVALVFAQTLFATKLPLPVGLLFHIAWVMLWSVVYVALFRDRLSFGRALGLAAFLWALALVVFFPFIGWGFFGLAANGNPLVGATITHILFAAILWAITHWVFGARVGGALNTGW